MNLFGLIKPVGHATRDDGDGIAARYCGVNVETVDVNITFLCQRKNSMIGQHFQHELAKILFRRLKLKIKNYIHM